MHRSLIVVPLILLAACAPVVAPAAISSPTPSSTQSATPTNTMTATVSIGSPTLPVILTQPPTLPATITPAVSTTVPPVIDTPLTPQPGLVIHGYVRLADGSGVPGVGICRNFASYTGTVVATTDANGYFQSAFAFIPGDEMVGVWPVAEGYTFEPDHYRWRHYYGVEDRGLDFVAAPGTSPSTPPFPCQ